VCRYDDHKLFAASRAVRLSYCCVLSVKPSSEDTRLICICLHFFFVRMDAYRYEGNICYIICSLILTFSMPIMCLWNASLGSDQFFLYLYLCVLVWGMAVRICGLNLGFGSVNSQKDYLDGPHLP
jgi:hypothetical protein